MTCGKIAVEVLVAYGISRGFIGRSVCVKSRLLNGNLNDFYYFVVFTAIVVVYVFVIFMA